MNYKKTLLVFGLLTLCGLAALIKPATLNSANLSTVSDSLSSSRLSVAARIDPTGTAVGSSSVKIKTAASAPFNTVSTSNINTGDSLTIGTGTYTVVTVVDADEFTVNPVLLAGDADDNDPVYLRMRPSHTITFTTVSAVAAGSFRILLPADPDGASVWTDGNPDDGGFDFTASPTVTGSLVSGSGYTFSAGTGTVSGGAGCTSPAGYHCFDVAYTGAGSIGAVVQIVIDGANAPIAPAPANTTEATAEPYSYIIQNLSAGAAIVDSSSGRIGLIEPVKVTATVDPIIEMTICGATDCVVDDVNPGDVVDGETLSTNTGGNSNGTSVALGSLSLSVARLQAQKISIATNASHGYALTAIDDGNLRNGSNDINDNVTPPTSPAVLNTPGTEAYGIHPCGTHVAAATWGTGTDTCAGGPTTNEYSGTDASTALTLVSYTTGPTASVDTYVTYKANISSITAQGDYTHTISYTATGTF